MLHILGLHYAWNTLRQWQFVHKPKFVRQEERPFSKTWHIIKPQHEQSMSTNIQNTFIILNACNAIDYGKVVKYYLNIAYNSRNSSQYNTVNGKVDTRKMLLQD